MRDSYYQYCRDTYPFDEEPIRKQFETLKDDYLNRFADYYEENPKEKEFMIKSVNQLCDLHIKMTAIQKARGKYRNRFRKNETVLRRFQIHGISFMSETYRVRF